MTKNQLLVLKALTAGQHYGMVSVSYNQLMSSTGLSKQGVGNCLAALIRFGYLVLEKEHTYAKPARYRLTEKAAGRLEQIAQGGVRR